MKQHRAPLWHASRLRLIAAAVLTAILPLALQVSPVLACAPTQTQLTISPNPGWVGYPITLTANVSVVGENGIPQGKLTFYIDDVAQNPITLDANGEAVMETSSLSAGQHTISASFTGKVGYYQNSVSDPQELDLYYPVFMPLIAQNWDSSSG